MKNWKAINRQIARDVAHLGHAMQEIPRSAWPPTSPDFDERFMPMAVWRSRDFFVQVVMESNSAIRICVNHNFLNEKGEARDGISWDDLFRIKNEIGYAGCDCIEIYPAVEDLVNVANMRHLFVLPEKHPWNWRNSA